MIDRHEIVFILGAGASEVYGLPSSSTLLQNVQEDQSQQVRVALFRANVIDRHDRVDDFQRLLERGIVFSIDRFLETRGECDRRIGKALIAHAILKCETPDNLYGRGRLDQYYQHNWVRWLLNRMQASTAEDFLSNKVAFITFNYDRSLETLLQGAVNARYGQSFEKAQIIERIPVVHLYGKPGVDGYERSEELRHPMHMTDALQSWSANIQIIGEGTDSPGTPEFTHAHDLLRKADVIVFLGFGYDRRNVKRLLLHECIRKDAKIIGTAMGFYDAEFEHDVLAAFDVSIRERVCEGLKRQSNIDLLRNHVDLFE